MTKRILLTTAALIALAVPPAMAADRGAHDAHAGHATMAAVAHEEVVDGVKATFTVMDMKEQMHGMDMPKGMKETHHIMVTFQEANGGKPLTKGEVKLKVVGPDKSEQVKALPGMQGHFGADFDLSKKGRYGVMCKFKLADGKVRLSKFWYGVK